MAVSSPSVVVVEQLRSENEGGDAPASTSTKQSGGAGLRSQPSTGSLHSGRSGFIPALLPSFGRRNRSSPTLETLLDESGDGHGGAATTTTASSVIDGGEQTIAVNHHSGSDSDRPSEPVLVRAYSPQGRHSSTNHSSNDSSLSSTAFLPFPPTRGGRIPLPPIDAFSFDSILRSSNVKPELDKTIDAIAGLCHTYQNNLNTEVEYLLAGQQDLDERTNEVDKYAGDVLAETGEREDIVSDAEVQTRELVKDLSQEAADVEGRLERILAMLQQIEGAVPAAEDFPHLASLVKMEDDTASSLATPSFASSSPILERTGLDDDAAHLAFISKPLMPALTIDDTWPSRDEPESLQMPILSSSGVPIMERSHASQETVTQIAAAPQQTEGDAASPSSDNMDQQPSAPSTITARGHKRPLSIASFFNVFTSPPTSKPPSIVISHTPSFPVGYDDRIAEEQEQAREQQQTEDSTSAEATLRSILNRNGRRSRSIWSIAGIFGRREPYLDTRGKAPVR